MLASAFVARVLLIEDSERVALTVSAGMRAHGHTVVVAGGVRAADEAIASGAFDVAVVDIGLPDGSGLDWCRTARVAAHHMPILVLSARNDVADRVGGLDAGADDYLGKPFNLGELAARLHSRLRRPMLAQPATLAFADLAMDLAKREVSRGGAPLALTVREFDLLATLLREPGRVFTREQLIDRVWGYEAAVEQSAVDTYISYLRAKIDAPPHEPLIRTIRRVGYTLRDG